MLTYRIARSLKFTMTVLQHMILGAVRLIKMQSSAAKWCLLENKTVQYLQSHTRNHINLIWFEMLTTQTKFAKRCLDLYFLKLKFTDDCCMRLSKTC